MDLEKDYNNNSYQRFYIKRYSLFMSDTQSLNLQSFSSQL